VKFKDNQDQAGSEGKSTSERKNGRTSRKQGKQNSAAKANTSAQAAGLLVNRAV
jgi:hypothetical protein